MNWLLDVHISPSLAPRLAKVGVHAIPLRNIGKTALSDVEVFALAFEHDAIVVTCNEKDFIRIARGVDLHPGLIVLRSGALARESQWEWLEPIAIAKPDLVNRALIVVGRGKFALRDLP